MEIGDAGLASDVLWCVQTDDTGLLDMMLCCFQWTVALLMASIRYTRSDPDINITGWGESDRGVGYTFGPNVVESFLKSEDLAFVCRAHQVCRPTWSKTGSSLGSSCTYSSCGMNVHLHLHA